MQDLKFGAPLKKEKKGAKRGKALTIGDIEEMYFVDIDLPDELTLQDYAKDNPGASLVSLVFLRDCT